MKRFIAFLPGLLVVFLFQAVSFGALEKNESETELEKINTALTSSPGDLKLRYRKAEICVEVGQWDAAMEEAKKMLAQDKGFAQAHVILGRAHLGKENYKDAMRHFEQALEAGIDFPSVYLDMAVIYAYGRDYESAIRQAKKAVAKRPDFAEGYYTLGRFYTETERYAEGLSYFEQTLELDPDHLKARELLALCYLETGNKAKARDLALEIKEEEPVSEMAAYVLKQSSKRPS